MSLETNRLESEKPSSEEGGQLLDVDRQQKAREYARIHRRLMLIDLALGTAYLLVWLLTGLSIQLRNAVQGMTSNPWLVILLYVVVFGAIYFVINLPLSYYEGYVLPHRYRMSNQTLKDWIVDQVKGAAVAGPLALLMLELVYWLLRIAPASWWIWAALMLLVFNVLLANLAPIILMPIFYKFVPLGEDRADLVERLVKLFERAGTHVQGVYRFDMSRRTKAANAALTGLGNTRRIILGDTLLNEFSTDEIETVMAHELGHHVHKDIPLIIAFDTLTTIVGLFLASLALNWGVQAFGFAGSADIAALPLLALIMGLYGLITMPLSNGFSRWRERLADLYALESTQKPKEFASAMIRLANQNLAEADPERWVEVLLYSHPSISARVRLAESYEAGLTSKETA